MSAPSAETIAKTAKAAFEAAQLIPSSERNCALHAIKAALESVKSEILAANKVDLNEGKAEVEAGRILESLYKRLDLNKGDICDSMLQGLDDVANLPNPTGQVSYAKGLDDGLELYRVSCPIDVLLEVGFVTMAQTTP